MVELTHYTDMKNLADLQMVGADTAPDTTLSGVRMFDPTPVKKVSAQPVKRPDYRMPTKEEQIRAWELLAFQINLRRVTGAPETVETCLRRIDAFVGAHNSTGTTPSDVVANVVQAFWEQIAETPSAGLAPAMVAVDVETAPKKAPVKRAPAKKTRKRKTTTGAKRGRKPKVVAAT